MLSTICEVEIFLSIFYNRYIYYKLIFTKNSLFVLIMQWW